MDGRLHVVGQKQWTIVSTMENASSRSRCGRTDSRSPAAGAPTGVMTYDPDDREYPFKGRVDGTVLWLAPS
jgi:hypothetical protein